MANLTFDFLHHYQRGERRESDPANAYQYDEGHILEAVLPETVTSVELHYWTRGMEEAEAYTPSSITANDDGSCTVLGNIPNKFFETDGDLRVYIVVNDAEASITTYEGKIHVVHRAMPDDYVDDDPENEATRVLTEAREAAATATAAAQTAQDVADSIPADYSQLSDDVSTLKEDKADIDGYYQDMTVGDAEQLVASQYVEDSAPYNFRTTGGSADVGNREYVDAVVGGSLVWNQLASPFTGTETNNGITYTENGDGTITLAGTATSASYHNCWTSVTGHEGHKVLLWGCPSGGSVITYNGRDGYTSGDNYKDKGNGSIITAKANMIYQIQIASGFNVSGLVFKPQFIDLTQMFGSTIADYIYSLEQATAGAGVAWFRKLFPKLYYAYDAGSLQSVQTSAHKMVGFNQWNEEWEVGGINHSTGANVANSTVIRSKNYVPCLPSTTYYFANLSNAGSPYIHYYDANKNFVSYAEVTRNTTFTTPANARYIRFNMDTAYGTTYKNDICINLSWSGWRNGEYEEYQKHSYPLDDSLTLRGIPKLDAQNNLYYDGDEYLSDGTVNRRYGVVDLGTLTYTSAGNGKFYAQITDLKLVPNWRTVPNMICKEYATTYSDAIAGGADKAISNYGAQDKIYIGDSRYEGGGQLASALSGVYLVYELATPTIETAEPYQHIQVCDDFGTEEYVTNGIVPVGHNTRYPANLRDKLQHLPNIADDDGYYMIGQSNKQMHLELFRIPKAPTTDGTYTLKATVSGGTPTYTWEAQA